MCGAVLFCFVSPAPNIVCEGERNISTTTTKICWKNGNRKKIWHGFVNFYASHKHMHTVAHSHKRLFSTFLFNVVPSLVGRWKELLYLYCKIIQLYIVSGFFPRHFRLSTTRAAAPAVAERQGAHAWQWRHTNKKVAQKNKCYILWATGIINAASIQYEHCCDDNDDDDDGTVGPKTG